MEANDIALVVKALTGSVTANDLGQLEAIDPALKQAAADRRAQLLTAPPTSPRTVQIPRSVSAETLADLVWDGIKKALTPLRTHVTHLEAEITGLREKLLVLEARAPLEDQIRTLNNRLLEIEAQRAARDEPVGHDA